MEKTATPWPRTRDSRPRQSESKRPSIRMLIAEDNLQLLDLLTFGLCEMGYNVDAANDGEAAWKILCSRPIDLLITDNDMPKLRGLDLVRRMRTQSHGQPVIFISGDSPIHDPNLRELLSPATSLSKPFSITQLIEKVNKMAPESRQAAHREFKNNALPQPHA